ncbi:MAG TPA: hypothetical protein VGF25_02030 [Thermoleophilaceae bacterium]|jgi:hypothetical protein
MDPRKSLRTSARTRALLVLVAAAAVGLVAASPASATIECKPAKAAGRSCTSVAGPWVALPPQNDLMTGNWGAYCPSGSEITGTDVVLKGNLVGTFLETWYGEPVLDTPTALFWGNNQDSVTASYQGLIGCSPTGAGAARAASVVHHRSGTHRVVERNVLPGRGFTHIAKCHRGERLVRSGSGLLFYQRRAPSAAQLAAVTHRHTRDGKVRVRARGDARLLPPGRVRVQIHTLCRRVSR